MNMMMVVIMIYIQVLDDRVIGIETYSTITKAFPAMVMEKNNKKKGGFDKQCL